MSLSFCTVEANVISFRGSRPSRPPMKVGVKEGLFSSSPADAFPAGMSPGSSSIGGKSELELLIKSGSMVKTMVLHKVNKAVKLLHI